MAYSVFFFFGYMIRMIDTISIDVKLLHLLSFNVKQSPVEKAFILPVSPPGTIRISRNII